MLNAAILTGEQRYQDWIGEYVGAWRERAAANGGVLPDNVGPDGMVGGLLDGRWYGGHYGWSWPHGWYSVGQAAAVAALAAACAPVLYLLDLVRPALDAIIGQGVAKAYAESDSSLRSKWYPQLQEDVAIPTFPAPYRRSDCGWFDFNPLMPAVPVAIWHHSGDPADLSRLTDLRAQAGYDWRTVHPFRSKEEARTRSPGSRSSPATTPGTRSESSPRPRPRCGTGSRAAGSTGTLTSPRPTSTSGSSATRS